MTFSPSRRAFAERFPRAGNPPKGTRPPRLFFPEGGAAGPGAWPPRAADASVVSLFEMDAAVQFRCAGLTCDPEEKGASLAIGGQVPGAQRWRAPNRGSWGPLRIGPRSFLSPARPTERPAATGPRPVLRCPGLSGSVLPASHLPHTHPRGPLMREWQVPSRDHRSTRRPPAPRLCAESRVL